jgi:hypothetical protein
MGSPVRPHRTVSVRSHAPRRACSKSTPTTLELVWSYTAPRFFSTNISSAQRLPNGNTLITEGAGGRMFEITTDGTIVWEYLNPLFAGPRSSNDVYRAYRLPYDWIPQLAKPTEQAVTPPALGEFRVP